MWIWTCANQRPFTTTNRCPYALIAICIHGFCFLYIITDRNEFWCGKCANAKPPLAEKSSSLSCTPKCSPHTHTNWEIFMHKNNYNFYHNLFIKCCVCAGGFFWSFSRAVGCIQMRNRTFTWLRHFGTFCITFGQKSCISKATIKMKTEKSDAKIE